MYSNRYIYWLPMTDKALDKALKYLDENENEKQNKN